MLSLGWLLNHFYAIPLNVHGKVMAVSSVINVLGIRLCHIGIQMIIRVGSSIKGVDGWHLELAYDTFIISLLKGVKKEGRKPLFDEPSIFSMGGRV